jgi:CRISPR-associated protein Cmr1
MSYTYQLKALTDIWTGDRTGKPDRLITTGLLGSIRWWCEVVVRGLGGSACDPSNTQVRCPDRQGRRCVVCELFGCTGWARKFRFDVFDANGHTKTTQIKKNEIFTLRFTMLRPMAPEEWALLDVTLCLIADYGAIGGKTIYKPSDEKGREGEAHHCDYGIVSVERRATIDAFSRESLQDYVKNQRWRCVDPGDFAWASLENFWCVNGRYLTRAKARDCSFNRVLGRKEDKSVKERNGKRVTRWSDLLENNTDEASRWLAGGRGESKKVFSVKEPARTFGFINPGVVKLEDIRKRLEAAWGSESVSDDVLWTGGRVLDALFPQAAVQ